MIILPDKYYDPDRCYVEYFRKNELCFFDLHELEKPFFCYSIEDIISIVDADKTSDLFNPRFILGPMFIFQTIKENIDNFEIIFSQEENNYPNRITTHRTDIVFFENGESRTNIGFSKKVPFFRIDHIFKYDESSFPGITDLSFYLSYYYGKKPEYTYGIAVDVDSGLLDNEELLIIEKMKKHPEFYNDVFTKHNIKTFFPKIEDTIRQEIPYFFSAKDLNLL